MIECDALPVNIMDECKYDCSLDIRDKVKEEKS